MTNGVDPDNKPHSLESDLGLHCLLIKASLSKYLGLIQFKTYSAMGRFSRRQTNDIFLIFPRK